MTLGGEGTFGLKYDEEWCIQNSKIRKQFFQSPDNRKMQSLANKRAHEENPNQAIEHSRFMRERYTRQSECEKTAEGMRRYLSDSVNHRFSQSAKRHINITSGTAGFIQNGVPIQRG